MFKKLKQIAIETAKIDSFFVLLCQPSCSHVEPSPNKMGERGRNDSIISKRRDRLDRDNW